MATHEQKEEMYGSHWMERIRRSNDYFEKWESRFRCKTLEKYIEGLQTSSVNDAGTVGYYLNLFYSSIKVKKPSILFSNPIFSLAPKPWKYDWNPEVALQTATLKEDALNSFIQDKSLKFNEEIEMAMLDSWAYFGIIEVGYSAEWIKNPNAGQPILKSDYYDLEGSEKPGKTLTEPEEIPEKERVYFKRIPAHRFRVGGSDSHDLERCNWVGYYEFVRTEDILANKKSFKNVDPKDWPSTRSDDFYWDEGADKESEFTTKGDFTKIWKIWDVKYHKFSIILEDQEKCILKDDFQRIPLFPLRWDLRRKGFYPVPATFNWKSPQDEYNESRNQMKAHRRRVRQMWQTVEQTIDPDEIEKFVHGPDGTIIFVKRDQAIQPINNAPLDASIINSLNISSSDFDKVSGTSNPQRGVSDRTTATEAATIEQRSRVREEVDRTIVAEWLCSIAKETLLVIIEKFSEPFWVKKLKDPSTEEMGDDVQTIAQQYQLVHSAMLEDKTDFDVSISVDSMSPVTNEAEKRKFFEFISIIQNFPTLSLHPTLIREAAYRCDYRNEQVIQAVQKMAQLSMIAKQEEGNQNLQNQGGGNLAQNIQASATPPLQEEVRQQVANGQIQ